MKSFKILGSSKYLPSKRVSSDELDAEMGLPLGTSFAATGVEFRHYAAAEESTRSLAVQAASAALADAGIGVDDLSTLIVGSTVPEQAIPSTASLVLGSLACTRPIAAFDVNATCLSFLVGLESALFRLNGRPILVVSSEMPSLALDFKRSESTPLFGDGAAAVVVAPGREWNWLASVFETYPEGTEICQIPGFGTRRYEEMKDPARFFELTRFRMDGPKLFRLTSKKLDPFMDRVLGEAKLKTLDDIDFFVFHQASGPALELVCRRFQIPEDRCVRLIRNHGNTVAASLGMGLDELLKSKRIKPGHKVMMMGSSAGVALGALVFERC